MADVLNVVPSSLPIIIVVVDLHNLQGVPGIIA